MEIIEIKKKEDKDNGKTYQYKCICGCRFNATYPEDFWNIEGKNGERMIYVNCPNCNQPHNKSKIAELRYYLHSEPMTDK